MYDKILYPTDGSEGAECVIDHVRDLLNKYNAEVHLLYVVAPDTDYGSLELEQDDEGNWRTGMFKREDEPVSTSGMAKGKVDVNQVLRAEGESYTAQLADDLCEDCATVSACREGTPSEEIVTYAEENDIDLIAMGTHGRSGAERTLLGSVTEKVIRHSETPVLTVHLDS